MNTVLSFMDKLYSDSKTLSIVYVIGAVLLFIFIILLMVSLRKTDKKEQPKIIEEPKIDDVPKNVIVEEKKEEALLKEEGKVSFVGFGTFSAKERAARDGINPLTKEPLHIPAKMVASFKAGSKLKDALN